MEKISDDKQILQSDDAKTGKYGVMKTVVNMYLNSKQFNRPYFGKGLLTATV